MAKFALMALAGELEALSRWISGRQRLVALTGAGCSTESGIPDYRDESGAWKRPPPMTLQEFVGSASAQRRYWARAAIGWRRMRAAQPGRAHRALSRLESAARLDCLITQNVDGLHQRAGSRRVIDLHGRIDTVLCLSCRERFERDLVQAWLETLNPGWLEQSAAAAPDGDAIIEASACEQFVLASCPHCGGVLKPAVVFFGESVPPQRVASAYEAVERSDGLLVVGSSLMVYSGYRFVRHAVERGLPIAIVNRGTTRADPQCILKLDAACGEVLEAVTAGMLVSDRREPGETSTTQSRVPEPNTNQEKQGEPL